jgi:hypothetical protein
MYINIPVVEVKSIIKEILNNYNETPTIEKQELETLLNTVLEYNYMQFNDQLYKQNKGLAMGAPMSAALAETFIQHLEHKNCQNSEQMPDHRLLQIRGQYIDYIQYKHHKHRKHLK